MTLASEPEGDGGWVGHGQLLAVGEFGGTIVELTDMRCSTEDLLSQAFTDPSGAFQIASERLPGAAYAERCELLRVMGNACRELRHIDDSIAHLEESLAVAVMLGDPRLEGNAAMSLAATLSYQGEFVRSLDTVERAVELLQGDDHVVALSQQAGLLHRAGRQLEALDAFSAALDAATDVEDQTIRGDLWMNRGVLHGFVGNIADAEADTQNALNLFEDLGWMKRAADMQHNLAWLAGRRGDVVDALRRFDAVEQTYGRLGLTGASVFPDRCEVLIAAGLALEALALAERSARSFADQGDEVDAAESLLLVARAALLAGEHDRALDASDRAAALFVEQDREGWQAEAIALGLDARLRLHRVEPSDRARATSISTDASSAGLRSVSAGASLVAAEIAFALDDHEACASDVASIEAAHLGTADRYRLVLIRARLAAAQGRQAAALELCVSGLRDFADVSAALGGTELRAYIARHVEELVDFGTALALDTSDPMLALRWAERQRASVLAAPPVLPAADPGLERELNQLRSAISELDERTERGSEIGAAWARCVASQDRVRRLTRQAEGSDGAGDDADPLSALLDATEFPVIMFVESERRLHSIRVELGRVTVVEIGMLADVQRLVAALQARFAMHLSAVGRGIDRDPAPVLADAAMLDAALFPGGVSLRDRAVVCPTGRVYDVPWGLLPSLSETAFVLAPSIESFVRCTSMANARPRSIAAIAGPDLDLAEEEAHAVGAVYESGEVLHGGAATVDAAKRLVQGVDVAHFACHGRFVSGNPMFSSLGLSDGQMFVHEIERVRPAPVVAVLSACNAGLHASPTGRQTLGLTTSLLAGGSRSVIAATVPVPDTASTVDLMRSLHSGLVSGTGVAATLRDVRANWPVLGGAFSCHGAGWAPSA